MHTEIQKIQNLKKLSQLELKVRDARDGIDLTTYQYNQSMHLQK